MRRYKKAVASCGEYQSNGQTKKRYQNVGTLFERDDGSLCLKLDAVPVGPEFEGWINFFDFDEKRQQRNDNSQQQRGPEQLDDEEIPF